jgi:hypothetical protein
LIHSTKTLKNKIAKRHANFKLIDTNNIAPFHFNTIVLYNSSCIVIELENILEHEKCTASNIILDVLFSRLLHTFFGSIQLYGFTKAMIQNLEFIADKEALKNNRQKKAYQLTLLKITTKNCVAITNHFINH